MFKEMPAIMDIVLLTSLKTLSIDTKEASTALSTYLKSTATRVAAKKHKMKYGSAYGRLQIDNSVDKETPQPANSVLNSQHTADKSESDEAHITDLD